MDAIALTSTDAGDQVGVKDGWYPGDEGWRVNSVGVVRPATGGTPYALAIVTNGGTSLAEGIETIQGSGVRSTPLCAESD